MTSIRHIYRWTGNVVQQKDFSSDRPALVFALFPFVLVQLGPGQLDSLLRLDDDDPVASVHHQVMTEGSWGTPLGEDDAVLRVGAPLNQQFAGKSGLHVRHAGQHHLRRWHLVHLDKIRHIRGKVFKK